MMTKCTTKGAYRIRTFFLHGCCGWRHFVLFYPLKFQTKQSFSPEYSANLYQTPWKIQGQKPRPLETPHHFFLDHPRKIHIFFNQHMLEILQAISSIPLKIPYSILITGTICFFSGIDQLKNWQLYLTSFQKKSLQNLKYNVKRACMYFSFNFGWYSIQLDIFC